MTQYKLYGTDDQEYGPVGADVVRRWIAQGRLNGEARVCDGDGDRWDSWRPLRSFAEFAADLDAQRSESHLSGADEPGAPPVAEPSRPGSVVRWLGIFLGRLWLQRR